MRELVQEEATALVRVRLVRACGEVDVAADRERPRVESARFGCGISVVVAPRFVTAVRSEPRRAPIGRPIGLALPGIAAPADVLYGLLHERVAARALRCANRR